MPINETIIKRNCPCLVFHSDDKERSVNVEEVLKFASLVKNKDGFPVIIEKVEYQNPQIESAFLEACSDQDDLFLDWHLLDKLSGGSPTLKDEKLQKLLDASPDFPAYYSVIESPEESGISGNYIKRLLKGHYIINYAFYFPSQNGFPYEAALASHEGMWSAFSLLMNKDSDEPVFAGFHGKTGVRVFPVSELPYVRDSKFKCYVSLGTHSFFEAPGDYIYTLSVELSSISSALTDSGSEVGFEVIVCTPDGSPCRRMPVSENDGWLIILGTIITLGLLALTKKLSEQSENTSQEIPPEPTETSDPIPVSDDNSDDNIQIIEVEFIEHTTSGNRICPVKNINTNNLKWWKFDNLLWGDQDLKGDALSYLEAGEKRTNFIEEFVEGLHYINV